MFSFLTGSRRRKAYGDNLYQACVTQARTPEFYRDLGVPDTPEGRYELISLHVMLLIRRLNTEGSKGREAAQEVFDSMFRDMDYALREMGVGDMSVSKKIRALAKAFYARMEAFKPGLDERDAIMLSDAMLASIETGDAIDHSGLATYALACEASLGAQDGQGLLTDAVPSFASLMRATA